MSKRIKRVVVGIVAAFVLLVLAILGLHFGQEQLLKQAYPVKYDDLVEKYAAEYEVSPSLIYGVIRCESSFDPKAVSSANAKGLMQLTDDTFEWTLYRLGETSGDVFDPETNVRSGVKLLQYLLQKYENEQTALAAYNAGGGNVDKWLKDTAYSADGKALHTIPFAETREYVKRVDKAKTMYQTLYGIA